ncbi:NAD(P)-binding oxidoreductase [Erwinia psidii]|uniref:NAD(P)-dependent oxidoreductase n=1 Tax=Erwinia psidii TaxID=69224 RepID=A0A3N6S1G0_9GAMM|nr:NAD(P)-binding oxidoreductase [Erwinia psidii]MCX8957990.1 NAD(P)-dependent oxidoreductase [Erwinia psidii]MCX8962612.1 NAD(P)-dependent oxidoreductase [Erwinia psidii]MCX8963935.1 NAD(P)-dependent oxidoreductase [Erwinia psidii]RQM39428.1 NAD(P)-dependent oxidoreductase [Erwinia psidii]
MATWLILGAARGTGAELVNYAVAHQQPVVVLVRKQEDAERLAACNHVQAFVGDACDVRSVIQACEAAGPDAVIISTLGGGGQDYTAHRNVIDCAELTGITRMLMVTSLGCGDSWPTLSERAKRAFGQAVREKSLAESWLQTSRLAWTIIRPGGLLNGEATGKGQLRQNAEVHGLIRRADVALAIVALVAQPLNNQIYSLVEPGLTAG